MASATWRASASDLIRASEVLGEAFYDYSWTRWTVDANDHQTRVTGLQRAALEFVGMPFREVWVTEVEVTIHSVAVSLCSQADIPQSPIDSILLVSRQLVGSRFKLSYAARETLKECLSNEPYSFLVTIGNVIVDAGTGARHSDIEPDS